MYRSRWLGRWTSFVPVVMALALASCAGGSNDTLVAERGSSTASSLPGPDQARIEEFIRRRGYEGWPSQDAHLSGAVVEGVTYAVHEYMEVHYSPAIAAWITGTPPKSGSIPDSAMIVALEYQPPTAPGGEPGPLLRARSMVRSSAGGSHDGWYWSTTELDASGNPVSEESRGSYGEASCFGCHASADNDHMVFLDAAGPLPSPVSWTPDAQLAARNAPAPQRTPRGPRAAADPRFLAYYDVPDVPASQVVPFPAKELDRVWAGQHAGLDGTQEQSYITSDQCMGCHNAAQLLSGSSPNMWYPEPDPSTTLVDGAATPDAGTFRNYSAYGEWSASLNALSGRDPVWHAQVDFERKLRPGFEDFTTDTCFLCHGPMAQRQIKLDRGPNTLFTIDMFYDESGPNAKYGALARDGVSCAVCHQIGSPDLGVDPEFRPWRPDGENVTSGFFLPQDFKTYTAMFPDPDLANPTNPYSHAYFGPYPNDEIQALPMDRSIGQRARWGAGSDDELTRPQISESKLCGSCHTVLVPALPVGYALPAGVSSPFNDPHMKMSFEQTTYFEWRNSQYENEQEPFNDTAITCQGCHMASHREADEKRIVNMESDRFPPVRGKATGSVTFQPHGPIYRHVLLGINYFVFEMFEQFSDLLGAKVADTGVPPNTLDPTLNARDWVENHAEKITADVRITELRPNATVGGQSVLEVGVEVTNYAGHKFPTGAGFRRAFLDFEVLGADDRVLWASGRTDELGVLVGPDGRPLPSEETLVPGNSQPHHQIITAQDQVQIYETRALSSEVQLQTTVLGIYYEYKDNRIPPIGYVPPRATDIVSRQATASALVGNPAAQPPGIDTTGYEAAPDEAKEHPTVLDDGTRPFQVVYDRDYWDAGRASGGQDNVLYRVPLAQIEGWERVRVQLHYQTIPPYYLRDRFQTGQSRRFPLERDMNRLVHMASRLNLDGTPAENWSLRVGPPAVKARGDAPDAPLTRADKLRRLQDHFTYLDLSGPATHR